MKQFFKAKHFILFSTTMLAMHNGQCDNKTTVALPSSSPSVMQTVLLLPSMATKSTVLTSSFVNQLITNLTSLPQSTIINSRSNSPILSIYAILKTNISKMTYVSST